jgi:hypothetical protein
MDKAAMVNTKILRLQKAFGRIQRLALLLLALGGVLLLTIFAFYLAIIKPEHEAQYRRCLQDMDKQIAAVRSGKTKAIYLYDCIETDRLLERLVDVPEVEEVRLDLTDVTDDGMKSLAALNRLKSLTIYGGRPSVGDRGFSCTKTISSLEHLELINTKVTDQSLPFLKDLPNLRSLVLFHEARRGPTFTDAGLMDVKVLTKLRTLNVSGGWASDAAVEELHQALPNCTISTNEDDLDI